MYNNNEIIKQRSISPSGFFPMLVPCSSYLSPPLTQDIGCRLLQQSWLPVIKKRLSNAAA